MSRKARKVTETQIEALRPHQFRPGQSGNPGGRPRKKPLTERYEFLLESAAPPEIRSAYGLADGATYGDVIAVNMVNQAIQGEVPATKEITDRVEGKSYIVVQNNTLIASFGEDERARVEQTMNKIRELAELE